MKDLGLQEMLRYALAGSIAALFVCTSYSEPMTWLLQEHKGQLVPLAAAAIPILIGVISYVTYRAAVYPLLYRLVSWGSGRKSPLAKMDIERWKNLKRPDSIQSDMREWAAQIHFLYASVWAVALMEMCASVGDFHPTAVRGAARGAAFLFLALALFHHWRYLRLEALVFAEDRKFSQPAAKPPIEQTASGKWDAASHVEH